MWWWKLRHALLPGYYRNKDERFIRECHEAFARGALDACPYHHGEPSLGCRECRAEERAFG